MSIDQPQRKWSLAYKQTDLHMQQLPGPSKLHHQNATPMGILVSLSASPGGRKEAKLYKVVGSSVGR